MYNETFYWKFITSLRCRVASWQIIWHCPQICKPPAPNGENKVFCLWWGWETTIERSQWQKHKQTLGNLLSFSLTVAWHLGFREWWLRIPDIFAASETHEREREGYDQKPKESMSICTINCADIHNSCYVVIVLQEKNSFNTVLMTTYCPWIQPGSLNIYCMVTIQFIKKYFF